MTATPNQVDFPTDTDGQRFRADLHGVREDVVKMKDDLLTLGHDVAGSAHSGIAAAKREASHTIDHAKERGEKLIRSVSQKVADSPLTSIGIAIGAGLFLGMFILRPRS